MITDNIRTAPDILKYINHNIRAILNMAYYFFVFFFLSLVHGVSKVLSSFVQNHVTSAQLKIVLVDVHTFI